MRKIGLAVAAAAFVGLFAASAVAQSSGNFAARIATLACTVNDNTGELDGGLTNLLLSTTIKTPNSSKTALLIRPSLLTGLFTKSKATKAGNEEIAVAGVKVRVLLDGKIVAPGTPVGGTGASDGFVSYDKRFQKLSTNAFNKLDDCEDSGGNPEPCEIELILSTLGAHSMDFVAGDVGGATHTVTVEWILQPTSAGASEAACVGPGVLTVQQVKTFSTGGGIVISPDN